MPVIKQRLMPPDEGVGHHKTVPKWLPDLILFIFIFGIYFKCHRLLTH